MPYKDNQPALTDLGYLLAEAPKNVVFVLGAGLSVPAGLPTWPELSQKLLDAALKFVEEDVSLSQIEKDERKASLQSYTDPWHLGDAIQETLPRERFVRLVKASLSADTPPAAYRLLSVFRPAGFVSYNLDRLASLALNLPPDHTATADEPSKFLKFLLLAEPFLLQPHGTLTNTTSWVLGARARTDLLKGNQLYRRFINNLFGSKRLVLVGFQPSDFAFESLLLDDFRDALHHSGVEHFWLTERLTIERRSWAALYNITPIEYEPSSRDHPEVFDLLQRLASFRPRTPPAPLSYVGDAIAPETLPPDAELLREPVEAIRYRLNAALRGLVGPASNEEHLTQIVADFYQRYSGSVHMAWHVIKDEYYGRLWGTKLLELVGDGAFAKVWKARDPVDGSLFAVKVLREDVLTQAGFLEAFRRGVNASKILSQHSVDGMVRFARAYDIPACVFMEFVEGETLRAAVERSAFGGDLARALRVIMRVAAIVSRGHGLKENVLHRDLKPSNVMLRSSWGSNDEDEVVVLDFDLSWYEGAMGRSAMPVQTGLNYLAPEQTDMDPAKKFSSRHTAVDVFGLGMLLFFVVTGIDPRPNVQRDAHFIEDTTDLITGRWKTEASALPTFLTGVIRDATWSEQPRRLSVSAFIERLVAALEVLESGRIDASSPILLSEIALRMLRKMGGWKVDGDLGDSGVKLVSTSSGARMEIALTSKDNALVLGVRLANIAGPDLPRGHIGKYLKSAGEKAAATMRRGGQFSSEYELGQGFVEVSAVARSDAWSTKEIEGLAEILASAAGAISLS